MIFGHGFDSRLVHFEKSLEISGFTEVKANFKGFF